MAHPLNPLEKTFLISPPPLSKKTIAISGIALDVYGLEEVPGLASEVACLWLLHPRRQNRATMAPVAATMVNSWYFAVSERKTGTPLRAKGLIAVCFDMRNHGSREVDKEANGAWRDGNQEHAQDMFAAYQGSAADVSLLLTYLSTYIYPSLERVITTNIILGVSFGAHAAWQAIFQDPRVNAAIIMLGCPDYMRVMRHRAEKSKLKAWVSSKPPGSRFFGSTIFPKGLVEAVKLHDPAGRSSRCRGDAELRSFVQSSLCGKRILNLCGGADKLVPYVCSEPFLKMLKNEAAGIESLAEGGFSIIDRAFEGAGHEVPYGMVEDAVAFIQQILFDEGGVPAAPTRQLESKL